MTTLFSIHMTDGRTRPLRSSQYNTYCTHCHLKYTVSNMNITATTGLSSDRRLDNVGKNVDANPAVRRLLFFQADGAGFRV